MKCSASTAVQIYLILTVISAPSWADGVATWGLNRDGELGDGTKNNRNMPHIVQGLSSVSAVASTFGVTLALQEGQVSTWGAGWAGQFADGTTQDRLSPGPVIGLPQRVTAIAAGGLQAGAIADGRLYMWGTNGSGQLGDGTTVDHFNPALVTSLQDVSSISLGTYHTLAISSGAAYAWGYNSWGMLGDGTNSNRLVPVQVSGLTDGVTAVAAGWFHSLAIRGGAVYAWGAGGLLGDGTTVGHNTPAVVMGLTSGVTAIAAGAGHSLAVKEGQVYVWGDQNNVTGEMGVGDPSGSDSFLSPVLIPQLSNIVEVACAASSSYALSADGSLWVWGGNYFGQLGLGDNEARYAPEHLLPPEGYRFSSISVSDEEFSDAHVAATIIPVPEPGTVGFVVAGLVLLQARKPKQVSRR